MAHIWRVTVCVGNAGGHIELVAAVVVVVWRGLMHVVGPATG